MQHNRPAMFSPGPFTEQVRAGRSAVRLACDEEAAAAVQLDLTWRGPVLSAAVSNHGDTAVIVNEVVLCAVDLDLPGDTRVYAEGFQMLSQYEGTVGDVALLGGLADAEHYRLPRHTRPGSGQPLHTAYGMAVFGDRTTGHALVGFTSCRRFGGQLRFAPGYLEVVVDAEGRRLDPGTTWQLEDVVLLGPRGDLDDMLAEFAAHLAGNHPRPVARTTGVADPHSPPGIPTGWCSWYCFGPEVTADDVTRNIDAMPDIAPADDAGAPAVRFVLVDDGYQARMGDWFDPAPGVPDIAALCRLALDRGCEPAIWVAPFIAEAGATVVREHPEWFVHDEDGRPLPSDHFSFGGWRNGPWYCLDGTHPQARRHLRKVFARMRADWGCRYFKLDAQMWGAFAAGVRHDPTRTGVEAYRMAMAEILDEVAPDGILLGCNAPMWPSLGLVHAMRVSGDIGRSWESIRSVAREGLRRGWQHGRLWLNDPDCLLVGDSSRTVVGPDGVERTRTTELPAAEASMLAAYVRATGGLVFSGDDLSTLTDERLRMLRACLPPAGVAARFGDSDYALGVLTLPGDADPADRTEYIALNWTEQPRQVLLPQSAPSTLADRLRGQAVPVHTTARGRAIEVPARSGMVLAATHVGRDSSR